MVAVVEHSTISPPPDSNIPAELSLPVVFFDMVWYDYPANQSVLFFDFPGCSKSHFLDTIVPDLKRSLSLTLAQYLPLSGKIIHPTEPLEISPSYDTNPGIRFPFWFLNPAPIFLISPEANPGLVRNFTLLPLVYRRPPVRRTLSLALFWLSRLHCFPGRAFASAS
ncbi:anthocyanidin 3-o-glucoside 6''-o-acyltransferase [Phtheirospermum japonicum]|uniref:Anthocyanidin 3-o-glucoside 6''-o-acyltransferase n=1 Tax=Phtheirospermum japonicum TaxID=374723 RepID=A0A830BG88_9LAMI|nr:anthocyanidin 3-o-glucoside 6''-o-acyltransferase [Phtheirospermum japonicum]